MFGRHPVDRRLHLPAVGRLTTGCLGVIRAMHLDHHAVIVGHNIVGRDEIPGAEANFTADRQTVVLRRRVELEIVLFDPQLAAKRNLPGPGSVVLGIVDASW